MGNSVNKYCADKLKSLRLSKNLTQQELAEDLGVTQQQIARYENNLRQFKQDFLFQLADYFNVSINDFFPPNDKQNNELDRVLFSKLKELSNEDKKAVLGVINAIHKDIDKELDN